MFIIVFKQHGALNCRHFGLNALTDADLERLVNEAVESLP